MKPSQLSALLEVVAVLTSRQISSLAPSTENKQLQELFHELLKAGVRELRFVSSRTAVDQYGRKIKFVNNTFKIL